MSELDDVKGLLERRIEEIRNLATKPPNEACTCEWVIRPLLEAAGYATHEILPQGSSGGAGYPDYTILPGTQRTWYPEAKTWDKNLENGADAVQALNYANAQGKRWVVLSNGRQWLLFDNHLIGVEAPQRLVARAELDDPGFLDFMLALSRPSVTADKLGEYVTASRVRCVLDQQLPDRDSEVVKAITNVLKKLGIAGVQAADVAAYFSAAAPVSPVPDMPVLPTPAAVSSKDTYTLSELFDIRNRLWGTKPAEVSFPDNSTASTAHWKYVAWRIAEWLGKRDKLPRPPYRSSERAERWLINSEPTHPNGKSMLEPKKIDTGRETLYLETHMSAVQLVASLHRLCQAVGEPASGFVVRFKKPPSFEQQP